MKHVVMNKKYKLSFPDSLKVVNEALKKESAIRLLVDRAVYEHEKQAVMAINQLLYETAQKRGMSLYNLCFHTVPEEGPAEIDDTGSITQTVRLVPVEFELTHDGGYWKEKYFALKEKMRELIDSKEEE